MPVGNLALVLRVKTNQLLTTVRGTTFWENVMVCLTMAGPTRMSWGYSNPGPKMTPPRTHLWAIYHHIYIYISTISIQKSFMGLQKSNFIGFWWQFQHISTMSSLAWHGLFTRKNLVFAYAIKVCCGGRGIFGDGPKDLVDRACNKGLVQLNWVHLFTYSQAWA